MVTQRTSMPKKQNMTLQYPHIDMVRAQQVQPLRISPHAQRSHILKHMMNELARPWTRRYCQAFRV